MVVEEGGEAYKGSHHQFNAVPRVCAMGEGAQVWQPAWFEPRHGLNLGLVT